MVTDNLKNETSEWLDSESVPYSVPNFQKKMKKKEKSGKALHILTEKSAIH